MIDYRNPYTPGAGRNPKYLAGRDQTLDNAQHRLESTSTGYQARSVVYYGLRGVGKTVLLNTIEGMAENREMLNRHIEVKENSNLVSAIAIACTSFTQSLSTKEAIKDKMDKLFGVLKTFRAAWNVADKTFTFGMEDIPLVATAGTGELSNDITELLVTLGKYAQQADVSICFCIDEIQYAKQVELESLITAIHRIDQLNLPIIFFCAGLPRILKDMGDAKSYAERLFDFIKIDSLPIEDAKDAVTIPAAKLGVEFTEDAVLQIVDTTKGYPYFIQEMCSTIWENHDGKSVDLNVVLENTELMYKKLDDSFFRVRYDRCTKTEKKFMEAMSSCDKLPCTIATVAAILGKQTRSVSLTRGNLISKGLIYATGHGEIDFTVPQFDEFIRRTSSATI